MMLRRFGPVFSGSGVLGCGPDLCRRAMAHGQSLDETVVYCREDSAGAADDYPNAHAWNVEQAYAEMGGVCRLGRWGWEKEWMS